MTPQVTALVDKLYNRASPALQRWMAEHSTVVAAKVTRARVPHTVRRVLDHVESMDWSIYRKDGAYFSFPSRDYTPASVRAAVEILRGEGWTATPGLQGAYTLMPPASVTAAAKRAAALVLGKVSWIPPVPAQVDPQALRFERAGYFPVGREECWVIPFVKSSIKGQEKRQGLADGGAYRVPAGVRLPEHYDLVEPPDWAHEAVKGINWAQFRDYPQPAFDGEQAREVLEAWVPKENRYGLTGISWSGREFAATDGNALHVLHAPETAPVELGDGVWDKRTWESPVVYGGRRSGTQLNLTPTNIVLAGAFPDYRQVVPSLDYAKCLLNLSPADVKVLLREARAVGVKGTIVYHAGGFWAKKADSTVSVGRLLEGAPFLRVAEVRSDYKRGPPRVGMNARYLTLELAAHARTKLPTQAALGDSLDPVLFVQPGIQYGVVMPVRLD